MKKIVLFFCSLFLCLGTQSLFSQSNQIIDIILSAPIAPQKESALLIMQASGMLNESSTPEVAWNYLKEQKWFSQHRLKKIENRGGLLLGEASLIIMKSFSLKGGIGYSICPTPRNSTKELEYKGIFYNMERSPYTPLSGEGVLILLSRLVDFNELNQKEQPDEQ